MAKPLLRTKLFIPSPQPGIVHRPRLLQQISQGLNRKITLISAPAGFGKTTLLSEWIPTSQHRVAWLSLEEADNDPARFWTYFVSALQTLEELFVPTARAFLEAEERSLPTAQMDYFLTALLNDISNCSEEFVLVLDDFHQIHNSSIHEGMIFLVDHLPPTMHIVLTSRADPPLPLARLRARGQITELRADDLRFTNEEITSLLNEITGLDLSFQDIEALESRTEGWIAGLQLAAISMQRRVDKTSFIKSFTGSHRFIMDYLVDEVLSCQPEDVHSFLLETSILDRITGPLSDAISGRNDGQAMLEQLEEANLFIIPLDNERRWYRYHHLFAELLRSRLKEIGMERIPELHQKASEWLEVNGLLPEAIQHAIIAENFEKAAQLIERSVEAQRQGGEIATLTGWINALPSDIRRGHPGLCLSYALALADTAQNTLVESVLEDVSYGLDHTLQPDSPVTLALHGRLAAMQAYINMRQQRFSQAIELSQRARQQISPDDTLWSSFLALNLAGAYRFTSNWAAADQAYLEASELSRLSGDNINALVALSMRGEIFAAMGRLHASVQQFEQVLELAQAWGLPNAPVTGYALTGLARAWCEWNELGKAAQYTQRALECGLKAEVMDVILRGYLVQSKIKQAQGDLDGALEALDAVEPAIRGLETAGVAEWVNSTRVQIWLARGETSAAVSWAERYSGSLYEATIPSIAIVLARIHLVQAQPAKAAAILERALQAARAVGREGNAIQILVVLALAYQAQGDTEAARSTLLEALNRSEPEGYLRVFLDEGEPMRELIEDVRAWIKSQEPRKSRETRKELSEYIVRLVSVFPVLTRAQNGMAGPKMIPSTLPEALSERELEILHLLANGLSKRDIANRDVVSINTVKTQVKSIFGKLGVHSREDAISVARSQHLL